MELGRLGRLLEVFSRLESTVKAIKNAKKEQVMLVGRASSRFFCEEYIYNSVILPNRVEMCLFWLLNSVLWLQKTQEKTNCYNTTGERIT